MEESRAEASLGFLFLFSKQSWLIATLRGWKQYQRQTGERPVLSIVAYVIEVTVWLGSIVLVTSFGLAHGRSDSKLILIILALVSVEVVLADGRARIRAGELRNYKKRQSARLR